MNKPGDFYQTGPNSLVCIVCNSAVEPVDIALTKKLINRGANHYLCLKCLALRFEVSQDVLREKIIQYREMGCTLFI